MPPFFYRDELEPLTIQQAAVAASHGSPRPDKLFESYHLAAIINGALSGLTQMQVAECLGRESSSLSKFKNLAVEKGFLLSRAGRAVVTAEGRCWFEEVGRDLLVIGERTFVRRDDNASAIVAHSVEIPSPWVKAVLKDTVRYTELIPVNCPQTALEDGVVDSAFVVNPQMMDESRYRRVDVPCSLQVICVGDRNLIDGLAVIPAGRSTEAKFLALRYKAATSDLLRAQHIPKLAVHDLHEASAACLLGYAAPVLVGGSNVTPRGVKILTTVWAGSASVISKRRF